ncbi:retrovirus-related pol polyprotein from transposon TNT 1-94 [Tanacetum coccineum]
MAKASPTQEWLWHRRLSHINFNYINLLPKKDVVIGLPKLKYVKDQLRNRTMVEVARTMLSASKLPLFFWAEAFATAYTTAPSQQELDLLFGPLYDEFFNAEPTTPTNVNAKENIDNQAANTQFQQDEFINPFYTPVREVVESNSRNIDNSNMHTFNLPQDSEYRWTKDHPLTQVHGNLSKPVQTRR